MANRKMIVLTTGMNNRYYFFLLILLIEMSCGSSKIIPGGKQLINDRKIYFLYGSDHEAPRDMNGVMQFEYETVYAIPYRQYHRTTPEKGIRLSTIGYKRSGVWNKTGNKVAYLAFIGKEPYPFDRGQIEVIDVVTGELKVFDNVDLTANGLSWDESGDYLVFGNNKNEISILNIHDGNKKVLMTSKTRPEGISVSPDGKHVVFLTRDGSHDNDADGWRPNLYTIGSKDLVKIGLLNDKFGASHDFFWNKESSLILFAGFLLDENKKRLYNFWLYNLTTEELKPYFGGFGHFYQQRIRYWQAPRIYWF